MLGRFRRASHAERGSVAVELIVVLPILCMLLFGAVEFGLAMTKLEAYVGAAREGARYAAVRCQPDATSCSAAMIASRVSAAAAGNPIGPGSPSANVTCSASNVGQLVTVSWTQNIDIDIPFVTIGTISKTITASFRCE